MKYKIINIEDYGSYSNLDQTFESARRSPDGTKMLISGEEVDGVDLEEIKKTIDLWTPNIR